MSSEIDQYTLPNTQPIAQLECDAAFQGLSKQEKLYVHYLNQAAWNGGFIAFLQASPESPLIFSLLHRVFISEPIAELKSAVLSKGISEEEFTAFLVYFCGVFSNAGNYKSFGDSKIIPRLPKESFQTIIKNSEAYKKNADVIENLLEKSLDDIYCLNEKVKALGFPDKGITTYFSSNCTEEDANLVNEFAQEKNIELWNTRCFKFPANAGNPYKCIYEIRFASTKTDDSDPNVILPEQIYKEAKFRFARGDYDLILLSVIENLKKAKEYAANDNQRNMIEKYVDYFVTGSLKRHKEGSVYWIKDKSPTVESYIGFIENYRDPAGQRAEFEAFVSMVNPQMSKKFSILVDNAEKYLAMLPWGKDFETDQFMRPDFTSLDVMTFSGSGIPCGINIPNYLEIREAEGFKNVSLGNVINVPLKDEKVPFLSKEDEELFKKYHTKAFEVQVGLHELLGHGSGKLLKQTENDQFNFNKDELINPLTNESIQTFYKKGQTYDSVFGTIGSSYEECKAEAVGLFLSLEKEIVKIFDLEESEIDDVIYVNWLSELWTGMGKALESYNPTTKTWLQAHAQARYVLARVCIEAGEDFIKIEETEPGKNLLLTVDRSKLNTVGRKAMGGLLKKLQIYKSTADIENARKLYLKYSEVPDTGKYPWAKWRDIVLLHKKPRKIFVQSNTFLDDAGNVTLKSYNTTFEDYIQSWVDRFPTSKVAEVMEKLYERDIQHFKNTVLKNGK